MRRVTHLLTGLALIGSASVLAPAAALAQDAPVACDAYAVTCPVLPGKPIKSTEGGGSLRTDAGAGNATTTSAPSTLPFTGSDIVLLLLVGAGAVAGGGALVVAGRRRPVDAAA